MVLQALAERNLADSREAEEDLPGALVHLRRCRALLQRGRNAALEADVCRRLSSVYAEIADTAECGDDGGGGGGSEAVAEEGGGATAGDVGAQEAEDILAEGNSSETVPSEAEVCCVYVLRTGDCEGDCVCTLSFGLHTDLGERGGGGVCSSLPAVCGASVCIV